MRLREVFEDNTVDPIVDIKNLLMYIKLRGIKEVPTQTVISQLADDGVSIDFNTLYDYIKDFPIIDDVSQELIKFSGQKDLEVDGELPDKDIDMDKENVKSMASSALNKRKRK